MTDPAPPQVSPDELTQIEDTLIEAARQHVSIFNALCYTDREGEPWQTAPFQQEWHDIVDQHNRVVILAPAGHAKTSQIVRSWITRHIAKHPSQNGAIISNVLRQASKRLMLLEEDILTNPNVQAVYPHLRPERRKGYEDKWTDYDMTIERPFSSTDPTIQARGIGGELVGSRLDWAAVDDPNDRENTRTEYQRVQTMDWIKSTLLTRFRPGQGKIVVVATSWHEDDVAHTLVRDHGFHLVRYEACDENFQNILWPEQFTEEMLRYAYDFELLPIEFSRTLRNRILDDSFNRIKREYIDKCLRRGVGVEYGVAPTGALFTITGIDPASGRQKRSDLCSFFTFAVFANGDRQVVDIQSGRMPLPEMVEAVKTKHHAFNSLQAVESNGVQIWLEQQVGHETAIPIKGSDTGDDKWDPATGVESIALELYQGKWIIPAVLDQNGNIKPAAPEIAEWVKEMQQFQLGAHTGDRLMACYVGRKVAREEEGRQARRLSGIRVGTGQTQANPWRP